MKYLLITALLISQPCAANVKVKPQIQQALDQAAEASDISVRLLTALCFKESSLRPRVIVKHDGQTPSYGLCMIKESTARFMGFRGKIKELLNPYVNAYYAAKYLRYQLDRYQQDWLDAVSAYNDGHAEEDLVNKQYVKDILALAVEL